MTDIQRDAILILGALGAASYICTMFIRKTKNRSGSVSIQIVHKNRMRNNKVIKTIGCARSSHDEVRLLLQAQTELNRLQGMQICVLKHQRKTIIGYLDSQKMANTETIIKQKQYQIITRKSN